MEFSIMPTQNREYLGKTRKDLATRAVGDCPRVLPNTHACCNAIATKEKEVLYLFKTEFF